MLRNTFCHVPGIGVSSERELWSRGILSWDDFMTGGSALVPKKKRGLLEYHLRESVQHLDEPNPGYFSRGLPSKQQWRLFADFREHAAYLDIETSGLRNGVDYITTIALYDGESIHYYIQGFNLDKFADDIRRYKVVVTYNGKCFDIPCINSYFRIKMDQVHIDLRYLLAGLGYKGGLKGCERRLGIDRQELDGVNGYFAVLLWQEFKATGNRKALETLLAYNVLDAANLETLMVTAYNEKLAETPFLESHRLPVPELPPNPFEPDVPTIKKMKDRMLYY